MLTVSKWNLNIHKVGLLAAEQTSGRRGTWTETALGFRLDWERRTANGNIDIASARGFSPQPITPVFVFV
jgi:hypothetical protein